MPKFDDFEDSDPEELSTSDILQSIENSIDIDVYEVFIQQNIMKQSKDELEKRMLSSDKCKSIMEDWKDFPNAKKNLPELKHLLEQAQENRNMADFAYYFALIMVIDHTDMYFPFYFKRNDIKIVSEMPLHPKSTEEQYQLLNDLFNINWSKIEEDYLPVNSYSIKDIIGNGRNTLAVFGSKPILKKLMNDTTRKEIDKVKSKVPDWLAKPTEVHSIILNEFMKLVGNDKRESVSLKILQEKCFFKGIKDFDSNFAQMSYYEKCNQGKFFKVESDSVRLWEPVRDFIITEWNNSIGS